MAAIIRASPAKMLKKINQFYSLKFMHTHMRLILYSVTIKIFYPALLTFAVTLRQNYVMPVAIPQWNMYMYSSIK